MPVAVAADWFLWSAGTLLGLTTAVVVPLLTLARAARGIRPGPAFGGWLMPVVPPMVSAATGALLLPHTPAGPPPTHPAAGLLLDVRSQPARLARRHRARLGAAVPARHGPAVLTPTLFIVLGPLGQSVTAANLLGANAHLAVTAPYSTGLRAFGLLYGVPVIGFALIWAALAGARTVRAAPGRTAVRVDLVGVHLPGRHVRHGADRAGQPHRRHRLQCRRNRGVRRFGPRLGDRRGPHGPWRRHRRPPDPSPGTETVDMVG